MNEVIAPGKKTYTLFRSDLRRDADPENPGLHDIKSLDQNQIYGAWSILYIRPNGDKFYLKNRTPKPVKKKTRFQLLKEQP